MKRRIHGLLICALLGAAASAPASAKGDKGDKAGIDKEFAMMDTNKDGRVSMDEHRTGARTMFNTMDADKDGKVTADEMTAAHKAITGKHAHHAEMSSAEKIKVVDANGDGILTADEHEKASASMFARMDTNRDHFLSKKECAAGHAAMMKKPGT